MTGRAAVLRRVLTSRALRRVSLAFLGFSCAEHGVWVAMVVFAYEQGGTGEAAIIAVVQLLPGIVVAPWAARLADARGGAVGLWAGYVAQALGMGATAALMFADAPAVYAYAGATFAATAVTLTRPAQAAVLPELVDGPAELTAANAVTGWLESVSVFAGPALAGLLIALDGPGAVFAVFAGAATASALLVTGIARRSWHATGGAADEEDRTGGALAALRADPGAVALLGVLAMQFVAYGAFDVLVVVLAIETFDLGGSGGGFLNAAFGVGGIVGGAVAVLLVGRDRLVPPLVAGAVGWGVAFMLIGAAPGAVVAFVLFAAAGCARMVLDVAGRTLLQRAAPPDVLARVFGVLEGASAVALALGSLLVPLLDAVAGPRFAIAGVGVLLVLAAASLTSLLVRLDRLAVPHEELAVLQRNPLFAALSPPVLEALARSLERETRDDGVVIVGEGEPGDRFYLVGAGTVAVTRGGEALAELGPGDGFGEIALLRDGIRTSTVTARGPVTLYALERAPFLEAVTQHPQARGEAERLTDERLRSHG